MSVIFINPYRFGVAYDADAQAYITAVEAADGQVLETGVKDAINAFVIGCKADGIWNAIKASCILAGARTLNGALQPLVGPTPTNFNFVAGDYDRKTGLVGDGNTKYLDSNRNNNADPQNSKHLSVFISKEGAVLSSVYLNASTGTTAGRSHILAGTAGTLVMRINNGSGPPAVTGSTGFAGANRNNGGSYQARSAATTTTISLASNAPANESIGIFASSTGTVPPPYSSGRLAFYSIGESLDLALLDARVTTLINAFAAAIP